MNVCMCVMCYYAVYGGESQSVAYDNCWMIHCLVKECKKDSDSPNNHIFS